MPRHLYLASSQVAAIAERTGAELVYRPFLLGGVMQATPDAMRGALAAPEQGVSPADPTVLRDLIAVAGLDPVPLLAAAATEPIKEIFFGNDRLDFVEEALRA